MNMSGLVTAESAKLFQKTEENGIIFPKITNIGISLELVKKGLFGRFVREVKNRHSSQIIK